MSQPSNRRTFLQSSALGASAAFATDWGFLSRLPRVCAAEAQLKPGIVHFQDQIEPLVQLIEDSPRERLLEQVADRIHHGTSYQEVLAALLLAGIRNVSSRPAVGFKFHAVLCVNSCHLASLAGPDQDRWLPIFWALDYFKSAQADEMQRSGWHMAPVNESLVPDAAHARDLFIDAMQRWDEQQADVATAGLARTMGATDLFNLLASYAARDFRSIGHKAIFLANAWRTLQVIGWDFAEPILRSLTFAFLNHQGDPNPGESDLAADRPWRESPELISRFPVDWNEGHTDDQAVRDLIGGFRQQTPREAMESATQLVSRNVSPQSVWDGVFLSAGELLMRQPGIVALHGLTSANAIHYLWQNVSEDTLRRRLLLQACAFDVMFRDAAQGRGKLQNIKLEELEPASLEGGEAAIPQILQAVSSDKRQAAAQLSGYLAAGGDPYAFVDAARRMIFLKGRDAHDYKFSSAVLEDFNHVSPSWRDRFLALSVFNLKGTGDRDNPLVERTRTALG